MLILLGCYILIGYSSSLVVDDLHQFDYCMLQVWLGGLGLSMPLILATILVKMLRVHHIFTAHKILKRSAHLSDCALLVYTLLILSPNIILLILWMVIDPRYRVDNFIEHPRYIENVVMCHCSNYEYTWYALAFTYQILLSVSVVIVAIKPRNIQLTRFKDTKKVNLLIFLLYIVGLYTKSIFGFRIRYSFFYYPLCWSHAHGFSLSDCAKDMACNAKNIIHRDCKHTRH
jgi:uncharacterized protein with PQ loop repeat